MKKLFLLLIVLGMGLNIFAQTHTNESRMFIHPFKEVFVNFPTETLGSGVRLTIFLPEEKIPLSKNYPLVLFMGLPRTELEAGQSFAQKNQVILAIVSWEEWAKESLLQPQHVSQFIRQELMPYLETNYPVLPGEEFRTVAARGTKDTAAVLEVLKQPGIFGKIALMNPAPWPRLPLSISADMRFYIKGSHLQLFQAQQALESAGLSYGTGFAMRLNKPDENGLEALDYPYLTAPANQVFVKKLEAFTQADALPVGLSSQTGFRVVAWLENGYWFEYIPQEVRFSPPYLAWEPQWGIIKVIPGAAAGTVKIHEAVDKTPFSAKIKLKK